MKVLGKRIATQVITLLCISFSSYTLAAQSAFNINLDVVRRSVVFLHRVDNIGQPKEAGTGFLLSVPTKANPQVGYVLLVTARHIVDPQWAGCPTTEDTLVAIFNKKNFDAEKDSTGTVEVKLDPNWEYPEDGSVDIAVTVLNGKVFDGLGIENEPISISQLPNSEELKRVNSGAQIASAGLLLGASGTKRNYPIFKFGYVSSIPDEKIGVACCPGCAVKLQTEWMIAASLVPGNSGSPIFFVPVGFPGLGVSNQRPFLLGIQSTSFVGYDVAGMAPVQFLIDAIQKLNLADANLSIPGAATLPPQATPSSARPSPPAIPIPMSTPK